jgi:RecA-family ATPase
MSEIWNKPIKPIEWVVQDLLRVDRLISLLLGKPESGKSTLARQLAIAVTQGVDFLGRKTKRGKVLYWQSEGSVDSTRMNLARLGYGRYGHPWSHGHETLRVAGG